MLVIWITILFYGYLWFIRRNETKEEKGLREFFFRCFLKYLGNWKWDEYWKLED